MALLTDENLLLEVHVIVSDPKGPPSSGDAETRWMVAKISDIIAAPLDFDHAVYASKPWGVDFEQEKEVRLQSEPRGETCPVPATEHVPCLLDTGGGLKGTLVLNSKAYYIEWPLSGTLEESKVSSGTTWQKVLLTPLTLAVDVVVVGIVVGVAFLAALSVVLL